MWSSKDVSIIIILAVISFLYSALVGQLGNLLTGILGFNYLFFWGHAILIAFSFQIYEGKRWRFFFQTCVVALLTLPTYQSGAPFDLLARIPMIGNSFIIDLIFNSYYSYFKKKNKLGLWIIATNILWILLIPVFFILNMSLFYTTETLNTWLNIFFLLLPLILIEMIVGAVVAIKLYNRVKKELK